MKNKRGARGKAQAPVDEIIDELLCEDLDLMAEPNLHDEDLDEHLVESDEISLESELSEPLTEKESCSKKRGRPKKAESDTAPKSKKHKEEPGT